MYTTGTDVTVRTNADLDNLGTGRALLFIG